MRRTLALFCLSLTAVLAGFAQQPAVAPAGSGLQGALAVPATRVLAIGTLDHPLTPQERAGIMPREVPDTVRLYLAGKIDQWWVREDGKGVVFLLNVTTVDEARALLEPLPLGQAHLMRFDYMALGPLSPLRMLLGPPAPPTR